jgi:hypothetical protein
MQLVNSRKPRSAEEASSYNRHERQHEKQAVTKLEGCSSGVDGLHQVPSCESPVKLQSWQTVELR